MTQTHALAWLRPDAPYAPFVQVGLLACLRGRDDAATVHWEAEGDGVVLRCVLRSLASFSECAEAIASAPWPDLASVLGVEKVPQSIGSVIKEYPERDRVEAWRQLAGVSSPRNAPVDGIAAGRAHIAALLTDGAITNELVPARSRLVGGVKSDLSGFGSIRLDAQSLALELQHGPRWVSKTAGGTGLGLVPEVQTYGGVTGPRPDTVNESSALLYALITHAIAVLTPFGVLRATRRVVGGRLCADRGLVWPVHSSPRGLRALLGIFGSTAADGAPLPRGVLAVYRSQARPINTTISMYPWGERVA